MQPFSLLRALRRDCIDYVRGKYPFLQNGRTDLDNQLKQLLLETGTLFQDPILQLARTRKKSQLDFSIFVETINKTIEILPELKSPYAHQIEAWKLITSHKPTVVSTGTGSGKSEAFIIPILSGLIKQGFMGTQKHVGGLFIYPMNALVQDQFLRIFKYAAGSGLRVGIYNGAFKELREEERKKICSKLGGIFSDLKKARPNLEIGYDFSDPNTLVVDPAKPQTFPHILLTNYKMLEYMLLRSQDQPLVEAFDLKYLVLDEAHTYTGTLALEISCLLSRLRVHLGPERSNYLPVATSATLSGGKESLEELEKELSVFFAKLFGKKFPENGFLIGERYEDLPTIEKKDFKDLLKVSNAELANHLKLPFPQSMNAIAKSLFNLEVKHSEELNRSLHQCMAGLAAQTAAILLINKKGETGGTVSWAAACQRFHDQVGGSPELLESLLILLSQAYLDPRSPLLGLRLHLFVRSEPKLLWTLDGKHVGNERSLANQSALSFVSCKRCGQMALAGIGENAGGDGNVSGEQALRPLGDFTDELKGEPATEIFVLHPESSLSSDELGALGREWPSERYDVSGNEGSVRAKLVKAGVNVSGHPFLRVRRTAKRGKKTVDAPDVESCPRCGTTSRNDNPVMVTHRGGAATDISVYTASTLTNTPEPKEQKLLIFSDNRQETSFLAGFLTDRHRKINLRRALTGYLEECKSRFQVVRLPVTRGYVRQQVKPSAFDLAARLLISLEQGKAFDPNAELPKELICRKSTLQNLIPRSVLDRPYWKKPRAGKIDEEVESIKQWLLENYRMSSASSDSSSSSVPVTSALINNATEKLDLLDHSFRGEWILTLITELLLLDLSAGGFGEGHLSVLGLAMLEADDLNESEFTEFAQKNTDLGLGVRGIFILSKWLVDELLFAGVWSDLDKTGFTRDGFLPKYLNAIDPRFRCEKQEQGIIGRSLDSDTGLHKASRLARILGDLHPESTEQLRKIWAKKEAWDRLILNSPLQKYIFYNDEGRDSPVLRPYAPWTISSQVSHYKGSLSHSEFCVAPVGIDLEGIPTGKRSGDVWTKALITPNEYYLRLLNTPICEQSKLVRAREHNGMLSAADANDALLKFERNIVNTLIATPTLELGVDLPDLPTVIHRSVPPSASNYTQRSGRAGRGPKRAFVLTYCGLGSHDMTFFEEPESMVSGEILTPGIPDRNPFIIKRHINGLILEVLGLNRPNLGPSLQIRYWHEFVDVSDLRNRLQELARNARNRPEFESCEMGAKWQEVLHARKEIQNRFIDQFITELDRGLWFGSTVLDEERLTELRNELRRHASEFSDLFQKQISGYRSLVDSYLDSLEQYKDLPTPDENAPYRQAKRFAELYLGARTKNPFEIPRPLNDLAATGFLPNFDFPGQVIRFKGLKDEPRGYQKDQGQEDRMLQYDRGGTVALREFAPAQMVYGHGFIYEVARYLENDLIENQAKGYGVCSEGCTTLAPPESAYCPECQALIVKIDKTENSRELVPAIVQIREVHGSQSKAISDGSNFRERHYFAEEARRIGAPDPDEHYALKENVEVELKLHLTKDHYLKTVFLILNTKRGGQSTAKKVFYRKRGQKSGMSNLFQVALEPKEGELDWEPFIPSIQIEGQGIVFHLPFYVAHNEGLIAHGEADGLIPFQVTLCTLIKRASQRVLRLGPRSGNFDIQVHRIMEQQGNEFREKSSSFVLIDREPGGSGVIPLLWECWDDILKRVEETILKDCCQQSCYRCLRSFDNQAQHHLLDKRLFIVESKAPIVDFLSRINFKKKKQDEKKKVDERSPAEREFKRILLEKYPEWLLETQVERMKDSGGLLTIPDFELSRDDGNKRITVYIDGWKYHQDPLYFFGDINKRNTLSGRGYRVVTLPAGLIIGKPDHELLDALLADTAEVVRPFPIVPDMEVPPEMIPHSLDPAVKDQLLFLGVEASKLHLINFNAGIKKLAEFTAPIAKVFGSYAEKISSSTRPFAVLGNDKIIMRANQKNSLASQDDWKHFWIFYSCLSLVGYRPIVIWTDPKPRHSQK